MNRIFIYTCVFSLFTLINSCSKTEELDKSLSNSSSSGLNKKHSIREVVITKGLTAPLCDSYKPLVWANSNQLTGTWQSVTISISSPVYKVFCDGGAAVPIVNGLPFYGSLSTLSSQNAFVWMSPTDPNYGNQFLIVQGTFPPGEESALTNYINKFRTAYQYSQSNGGLTTPRIDSYVKPINGITYITGKLVRITDGSKFAVTATCSKDVTPCGPYNNDPTRPD